MATKKEVKNPRKPATKKISSKKDKKEEKVIMTASELVGGIDDNELLDACVKKDPRDTMEEKEAEERFAEFENYKNEKGEYDLTDADNDTVLDAYKKLGEDDQIVVEKDEVEKDTEKNDLNPSEVIKEFKEATQNLDNIVVAPNPEETLKDELKRADEIQEKLEKQIKAQEEKLYNPRNRTWNGISDGWYGY